MIPKVFDFEIVLEGGNSATTRTFASRASWRFNPSGLSSSSDNVDQTRLTEAQPMRIAILTNEYPPYIYGGALSGSYAEYFLDPRLLARVEDGNHLLEILSFVATKRNRTKLR